MFFLIIIYFYISFITLLFNLLNLLYFLYFVLLGCYGITVIRRVWWVSLATRYTLHHNSRLINLNSNNNKGASGFHVVGFKRTPIVEWIERHQCEDVGCPYRQVYLHHGWPHWLDQVPRGWKWYAFKVTNIIIGLLLIYCFFIILFVLHFAVLIFSFLVGHAMVELRFGL